MILGIFIIAVNCNFLEMQLDRIKKSDSFAHEIKIVSGQLLWVLRRIDTFLIQSACGLI